MIPEQPVIIASICVVLVSINLLSSLNAIVAGE